ncbi:MAG TPA: DNA gyrase/topoisomerase IV subunit A, partial [Candidatus Enterocola sp.]|nr:DNA gyrase/topoisomerase IV subunit A [Candidatus Enterocola sp.]
EKFDSEKIWTAVLYDAEQKNPYIKRFKLEASTKEFSFIGEHPDSRLIHITDTYYPLLEIKLQGAADNAEPLVLDADEYIGVKSYKAKGKRVATAMINEIRELEPLRVPEEVDDSLPDNNEEDNEQNEDTDLSQQTPDNDGQFSLF